MIDPLAGLSFTLHANRGIYALILGSGVSRAAQIPTGWEVTLDLVKRLARAHGEEVGADPAAWYKEKFGRTADYGEILDVLTASQEERHNLLRAYFEPTEDERTNGVKQPTAAHHAIASLVAKGHIKVIVTMNFDRLIEIALAQEGVVPVVVSTPDDVQGMLPLVHQRCCVIKVHGDYLDIRLKNTTHELSEYDPRVNALLDRVFDEFGVICCGWSATWDPALCDAIRRCASRRFHFYWAARSAPTGNALSLLHKRGGSHVPIIDADSFFSGLAEKVISLDALEPAHPLSVAAATVTAKRLLAKPENIIKLHDTVIQETEKVHSALQGRIQSFLSTRRGDVAYFEQAVSDIEILQAMLMTIAQWGSTTHCRAIVQSIERLVEDPKRHVGGLVIDEAFRRVPAILALYASGIAALESDNIQALANVLEKPTVRNRRDQRVPLLIDTNWHNLGEFVRNIEAHKKDFVPASTWLHKVLATAFQKQVPDPTSFAELFNRFEVVLSAVYGYLYIGKQNSSAEYHEAPHGKFASQYANQRDDSTILIQIEKDGDLARRFAETDLFKGQPALFTTAVRKMRLFIEKTSERYW